MMIGDYISTRWWSQSSGFLHSMLQDSRWRSACFRIDRQHGSFVLFLASITEIAAESLTVTDGIQGDPVSHRARLNQPQVAAWR